MFSLTFHSLRSSDNLRQLRFRLPRKKQQFSISTKHSSVRSTLTRVRVVKEQRELKKKSRGLESSFARPSVDVFDSQFRNTISVLQNDNSKSRWEFFLLLFSLCWREFNNSRSIKIWNLSIDYAEQKQFSMFSREEYFHRSIIVDIWIEIVVKPSGGFVFGLLQLLPLQNSYVSRD